MTGFLPQEIVEPDGSSGTPNRDEVRAMIQEEVVRFAKCLEESADGRRTIIPWANVVRADYLPEEKT